MIIAEVRPDLVREARRHWAIENDIYQFGRGFVAVRGWTQDCPYSCMHDLAPSATGCHVKPRSSTSTGRPADFSRRRYSERLGRAAE
jgi:formamidase